MQPLLKKETIGSIRLLAGGNEHVIEELFQSFLKESKELLLDIRQAVDTEDWQKLQFDVHALKGLCGTIGASALFEVCKILNDDLKQSNLSSADELTNEALGIYEDLVVFIAKNYKVYYEA